ncbi:NAD kinase [Flavisolibacter ginsengisoli]|uniref:NAD kinase n=1 Tax=Flavisolibacter ginsengisoli DSM 18119 TaxID=1121884 RepID=A0A1M5EDD7_9BACT|nr:NAD kinase [Flavisolibacter ginsengisoli]SHF77144.1 NAD+ kinase [Flavisolibacter ginsengisoli DSM 18119]
MKVAIYSRVLDESQQQYIQLFFDELHKEGIVPVIFLPFYNEVKTQLSLPETTETFSSHVDLNDQIDFVISLGGDGTLLDTVTLVRNKNIPVVGINFGRLGFLASIGREEMSEAIKALARRSYIIDRRTLIHLDSNVPMFNDVPYALNEFAIHKRDTSPMVKIHTYLNGELLNTYWADGLILATPTGSTGYSLSCDGPVVFPDACSLVLTPIAPHNLNVRPIVIPDNTIISFEVESRADDIICALDSRREIVNKSVLLAVRKENFMLNLVRLNENNFLQTLRNKLSWGLDKRN